jgi:hypothetical protein
LSEIINFVKDTFIIDIKPQAPIRLTITKDVLSTSVASTTHSGMTPPAPSSSTSGDLLRVLKSMFHMCQETHQR